MPSPTSGQAGRPSGLPQQIPPQTQFFGTVDKAGQVTIDQDWWLFLFNISKQVLSAPGSPIPIVNVATALTLEDDLVPPNPETPTVIDWMSPI